MMPLYNSLNNWLVEFGPVVSETQKRLKEVIRVKKKNAEFRKITDKPEMLETDIF